MNGIFLMLALLLELAVAISLRLSHGFSKLLPALAIVVFSALSLTFLTFALNVKNVGMSVVYAVWSGVGMAFIATMELLWK
jgi:small multidrug resistance pump